jgi:hypothetical protein
MILVHSVIDCWLKKFTDDGTYDLARGRMASAEQCSVIPSLDPIAKEESWSRLGACRVADGDWHTVAWRAAWRQSETNIPLSGLVCAGRRIIMSYTTLSRKIKLHLRIIKYCSLSS